MLVHRYWSGDAAAESGDLSLAGVDVVDWRDDDVPSWLIEMADATAWRVTAGDELRHRANVVRLGLLFEYGGWWADHDVTALARFELLPSPATAAHRGGHRCNCWLAFPAKHVALAHALAAIDRGRNRGRSMVVSGESLLHELWSSDEVARVLVRFDIDQRENMDAPFALKHDGRSSAQPVVGR